MIGQTLSHPLAEQLYEHARGLPLIDFHNHLEPKWIAGDHRFADLHALWIADDVYKHRAMRIAGVDERLITGTASPREKFDAWAAVAPHTLGTPLFAWGRLELAHFFGIEMPLNPGTAEDIWQRARLPSAQDVLRLCNVERLCTSDRLLDDLSGHRPQPLLTPSLRADDLLGLDLWFIDALARSTHTPVRCLDDYLRAVDLRLDVFKAHGCRIVDHAIDLFRFAPAEPEDAARAFAQLLGGERPSPDSLAALRDLVLSNLAAAYARRGWTLLLHLHALRETSTRLLRQLGPAKGYAGIGPCIDPVPLARFLDHLEQRQALPRTILFPLNPADFSAVACLSGSFVRAGSPGHVQLGPAWWYNDHAGGIRAQLDAVMRYGLLWTFVGFTTDSRSILSLIRHDYFRRVLCGWMADHVRTGELPDDPGLLRELVHKVCYQNARDFLFPATP